MTKQEKDIENKERAAKIETMLCDAILERPISFQTQDGRFYYIYQPSFGVYLLCDPIMRSLDIDKDFFGVNSTLEMTRVIVAKRQEVLRLVAYHSFKRRSDAICEDLVQKRIKEFDEIIDTSDLLTLFSYITAWRGDVAAMQEYFKIDKDRESKNEVHQELSKKGGLVYGGRSIYGQLIDFACQRYGWQMGYVVWGISMTNLTMMTSDYITTIQMTKEEMRKMNLSNDRDVIKADDPSNWSKIRDMARGT